jgi:hypothetical protein
MTGPSAWQQSYAHSASIPMPNRGRMQPVIGPCTVA